MKYLMPMLFLGLCSVSLFAAENEALDPYPTDTIPQTDTKMKIQSLHQFQPKYKVRERRFNEQDNQALFNRGVEAIKPDKNQNEF